MEKAALKIAPTAPADPFRFDNRETVVILSLVVNLEYWTSSCVNPLMASRLTCEQILPFEQES